MSSGQEALILGVSLSVLLPPNGQIGSCQCSGASLRMLSHLCFTGSFCCHYRCNVYTVWRRSAPLIVSIVWLLIKDYCPLQQGRTGLQGTPVYGMFDYALVEVSNVSSGVQSHLKTDILTVPKALPVLVVVGSTGRAPVNAQPLCVIEITSNLLGNFQQCSKANRAL